MSRKTKQKQVGTCIYEEKCKVCNSAFKSIIEDLSNKGLNPRQIFDYLNSLSDPSQVEQLEVENLSEGAIRRHLDRHFNVITGAAVKMAETKQRIKQSRDSYRNGVHMVIDSVSTLAHMIDVALINIEDLDNIQDSRQRHQLTINYMSTIKNLIDEFSKLTGDLKQEGTIDINFFNAQITDMANIVLATIHKIDMKLGLNSKLEYEFGKEFKKQWDEYMNMQKQMVTGEIPTTYANTKNNVNTFNDEAFNET